MYLEYYGLKREPFHITPDPSFLFLSPSHKEALGAIIYGVEKRKGFIAIIGEVGVGKTLILRAYLERKASQKQKTIYIFNPVLSFHELLISMFRSLELIPRHDNIPEMVNQLHEALIAEYQAGGTVVVAIDEAQNMPVETLENLRMFSNLETSTDKLIQIILLGQPELNDLLQQASLRQLKQRIVLWATIAPLTREESHAYIEHRIARACTIGATLLFSENENISVLFTKSAINLIARKAKGIPRRINIFCENALITGFGRQVKPVSVSVVREIIGDIEVNRSSDLSLNVKWAVGFGIALIIIVGVIFLFDSSWRNSKVAMQPSVKQMEENTSSGTSEPKPPASIAGGRQVQSQNGSLLVEKSSMNGFERDEKDMGFQREPSKKDLSAQPSVEIPSVDLVVSGSDEPLKFPSKLAISKAGIDGLGASGPQERKNSDHSSNTLYRKSVSDSAVGQAAITDIAPEVTSNLATRKIMPMANGNSIREVREGENLSKITMEAYGSHSEKYIQWVRKHNPQILNPDIILPGQDIVLPVYRKQKESQ
jgi:type II secretory pathway predicted ATPase ExeA